jgi:hypothetical protein
VEGKHVVKMRRISEKYNVGVWEQRKWKYILIGSSHTENGRTNFMRKKWSNIREEVIDEKVGSNVISLRDTGEHF